ncbi:MAG: hypothetical protein LWW86_07290 [Micrococcales bacterium]|nr:hypothetical protein [Micrococcales bacterium]
MITSRARTGSLRTLATGSAAMLGLTLIAAAPATAGEAQPGQTPCTYVNLIVPQTVRVAARTVTIPQAVRTDCNTDEVGAAWSAAITVAGRGAATDKVDYWTPGMNPIFTCFDPVEVTDQAVGARTYRPSASTYPGGSWPGFDKQNSPTMDVRLGSVSYISAYRNGTKVSVLARSYRWWQSTHAYGVWMGAQGQIQYRKAGTSTWRPLKNATIGSDGRYWYSYTTAERREYRVVFGSVPYVWGSGSTASAAV